MYSVLNTCTVPYVHRPNVQVCDKTFTEEVGFFERISSTLRSLALSVKSYGVFALRFVERVGNPNVLHSTSQRYT